MPALGDAAHTAGAIVRQGQEGAVQAFAPRIVKPLYAAVDPLKSWPTAKKLALLRRADADARAADSRLIPVMCSLVGRSEERSVGKECVIMCRSRWSLHH